MKIKTQKSLLALAVFTAMIGCGDGGPADTPSARDTGRNPSAERDVWPHAEGAIRYLALGDSYTIGEGVPPAERWPLQLGERLREEGFDLDEPVVIARTGWTTGDLLRAVERERPEGPFGLVTLLIGVNNQFQGRSIEGYEEEFAALLDRSIALAGGEPGRVVVASIPDWGVTPFAARSGRSGVGDEIDRFNAVNRRITERAGARYVDVTPISREAEDDPSLLAPDGLHPSGEMYARWAEQTLPAAMRALELE